MYKIKNGDSILSVFNYSYKVIFFATTSKSTDAHRIILGEETYDNYIAPSGVTKVNSPPLDISRLTAGNYYIGWEISIEGNHYFDCDLNNNVGFATSILPVTSSATPTPSPAPSSSDVYESNNTMATAHNLGTISGTRIISANIAKTVINKDYDWLQFTLPGTGSSTSKVSLSYSHSTYGDLDLELYDASVSIIALLRE